MGICISKLQVRGCCMRRGVRYKTINLLLPNNLSFWDSWFMMRVTRKEMRNTHQKEEERNHQMGTFYCFIFCQYTLLPIFFLNYWILLCQAVEASREPRRPKTHWDHVLEEMAWLSKVPTCFNFNIWNDFCIVYFSLYDFACYTFCFAGLWVREEMEISSGKESCFKSQQRRHVRSSYKGWKEDEGSDFSSINKLFTESF